MIFPIFVNNRFNQQIFELYLTSSRLDCLSTWLTVYFFTCLHAYQFICIGVYFSTFQLIYLSTFTLVYIPACLTINLSIFLIVYLYSCQPVHGFTYSLVYLSTYLPAIYVLIFLHIYESIIMICDNHFRAPIVKSLTIFPATLKSLDKFSLSKMLFE